MIEPKHTPTPWTIESTPSRIEVRTDPMHVYAFSHADRGNAEFIVRAVNAHEALVSALTETLRALRAHIASDAARTGIVAEYFCPCTKNEVARAEAALRAARGES